MVVTPRIYRAGRTMQLNARATPQTVEAMRAALYLAAEPPSVQHRLCSPILVHGSEPHEDELENITADVSKIVNDLHDRIAHLRNPYASA